MCFLQSWAVHRHSQWKFTIENINPKLCTHIVYAFAILDETSMTLKTTDPDYVDNDKAYERLMKLKQENPKLIITIGIGGWSDGSVKYSDMVASLKNRLSFISSIKNYVSTHNFDGVDFQWIDPTTRNGRPEDRQNFVAFIKELRKSFGPNWHIGVSINPRKAELEAGYDLPKLAREVNFFHILSYNFHGHWDGFTGHTSPLYPRLSEIGKQRELNVNFTLNYILSAGVHPSKLVLGIPFFGGAHLLRTVSDNSVGSPTVDGLKGVYIGEFGQMSYHETCKAITERNSRWKVFYSEDQRANYMINGNRWVSFENSISVTEKVSHKE